MESLNQIIKEIVAKNGWLSGEYDFRDGDLMALVNQPEKFQEATEINDLKELFSLLNNYDGVFKHKNLLFFNDWRYGCFVYDINNPDRSHYIEHLTIDAMSFESFQKTVNRLIKL